MVFHVPVMVKEVVANLVANPHGTYLDATLGGGGHSRAILGALSVDGALLGLDRDGEALTEAGRGLEGEAGRVTFLQGGFGDLQQLLAQKQIGGLAGVLFDLGVSSHQVDAADRGFSYRLDGPLDMRMDATQVMSAATLLEESSEAELVHIIKCYGEERRAKRVARSICHFRAERGMATTADLRAAVEATRPQHVPKTLARVFQALRIVVNDELGQLEAGLNAAVDCLMPGGRLVVIAYHSLEDRLVKTKFAGFSKGCICPPVVPICVCDHQPTFKKVGGKPRRATAAEVNENRRARSAILRVYEKL
jgi:16S rRNA (cytosine1402-N4)-methyltransferase